MARNDGVDRTCARNMDVTDNDIGDAQAHNEREKEIYSNEDIIPERSSLNVHFKEPTGSYAEMFEQMKADNIISTRGLKADAVHFNEMVFDVNSAYFDNHGGYEYARQFYEEAYKSAVEIVGGEQYILSAVMHADEINRAMSEALGKDVFHYHLHVVYVPVVEKQILWSKRCKDEALRGTVKETIMQVSRSKKWLSKPAVDKDGKPILQVNGKPVLRKSYSVLQDDFFQHMRAAGYTDVERGERDSTEEHLTVTQFKVAKEKQRLEAVTAELNQKEAQLDDTTQAAEKKKQELKSLQAQTKAATGIAVTVQELESMGKKSFTGNIVLTPDECRTLKNYAVSSFAEKAEKLKYQQKYETAKKDAGVWKKRYEAVLLLTKLNVERHIEVDVNMEELDVTAAESKATYNEIRDYVWEHHQLKVSNLYIAQVKEKCGIKKRENYNKPKSNYNRQPRCPSEKETAIRDALKFYKII